MTSKLVVIINSLKVPKIKKILLYEMKFLVQNYSCLQNPWQGGYRPQIPVLSVLCPQLNLLNPHPRTKFLGTPLPLWRPRRRCELSMKLDQWEIQEVKMGWSGRERFKCGDNCYWCTQYLACVNCETSTCKQSVITESPECRGLLTYLLTFSMDHSPSWETNPICS